MLVSDLLPEVYTNHDSMETTDHQQMRPAFALRGLRKAPEWATSQSSPISESLPSWCEAEHDGGIAAVTQTWHCMLLHMPPGPLLAHLRHLTRSDQDRSSLAQLLLGALS